MLGYSCGAHLIELADIGDIVYLYPGPLVVIGKRSAANT